MILMVLIEELWALQDADIKNQFLSADLVGIRSKWALEMNLLSKILVLE